MNCMAEPRHHFKYVEEGTDSMESLQNIIFWSETSKRTLPNFVLIRKNAVRLDKLFGKPIRQTLHQKTTHARSSSTSN